MASLRHIFMGRNGDYFLNYIDYLKKNWCRSYITLSNLLKVTTEITAQNIVF